MPQRRISHAALSAYNPYRTKATLEKYNPYEIGSRNEFIKLNERIKGEMKIQSPQQTHDPASAQYK